MPSADVYRIDWKETSWICDLEPLAFQCTDELVPLDRFIGQDRAQEAIRFGLEMDKPGYNLFVTGLTGTGKTSVIKSQIQLILEDPEWTDKRKPNSDWIYVHNFQDRDRPNAIRIPRGSGRVYRHQLDDVLRMLNEEVPKILKGKENEAHRRAQEEMDRRAIEEVMAGLEQAGQEANFAVQRTSAGVTIFPITEGRSMTPEEYQELEPEVKNSIDDLRAGLMQQVQNTMAIVREIERNSAAKIRGLERSAASSLVSGLLRDAYSLSNDIPKMQEFLNGLSEYILDHLNLFKDPDVLGSPPPGSDQSPVGGQALAFNPFLPFEINVLVDNSSVDKPPIIVESNPNWRNLFGRVEPRAMMGAYVSDHGMLKAGSVQRANGGYLVLNAGDMLTAPGVWEGLKRAIRDREARLEDPEEKSGFIPQGLRPEPIPLDLKVIVSGDESIYRLLTSSDNEDFWDLFKVKAEFDCRVDLNSENMAAYCSFICWTCNEERLQPFSIGGAAKVLEFAARQVTDQRKLSTRFGQIKDLLIEADYWARKGNASMVQDEHVRQAIAHKIYRLNLVEERIHEMVAEGALLLNVSGAVVGQINGLSVYDLGDFSFGRPTRITAETYAGREGLINIEREASLSGPSHNKGVFILSGYLGAKFAKDRPLTLSASLAFEQSYDGVDGDSASSSEIYAIVSSLADVPLRQDIAVTGSVNQKGQIQPIGGVNQKVEGMFDVCRSIGGLTGTQGVIIPYQNVRNLMLRDDVVEAVRDGTFHVYAVRTIDEGLEILTGVEPGVRRSNGNYPEGTINYLVEERLRKLNENMRGYYGVSTTAS